MRRPGEGLPCEPTCGRPMTDEEAALPNKDFPLGYGVPPGTRRWRFEHWQCRDAFMREKAGAVPLPNDDRGDAMHLSDLDALAWENPGR